MNVGELKKALEGIPDDTQVVVRTSGYIDDTSAGWIDVVVDVCLLRQALGRANLSGSCRFFYAKPRP